MCYIISCFCYHVQRICIFLHNFGLSAQKHYRYDKKIIKKKMSLILYYCINSLVYHYLPRDRQSTITHVIHKTVLFYLAVFYLCLNPFISNIFNLDQNSSLTYQTICDRVFSYLILDYTLHVFWLRNWVIFFLFVCSNFPLTSKTVRCCIIL